MNIQEYVSGQDENEDRVSLSTTLSFVQLWNEIKFIIRKSAVQQTQNHGVAGKETKINGITDKQIISNNNEQNDDKEDITDTNIHDDTAVDKQISAPNKDIDSELSADGHTNKAILEEAAKPDKLSDPSNATKTSTDEQKSSEKEIDEGKQQENQTDIEESHQPEHSNHQQKMEVESQADQENDTPTSQPIKILNYKTEGEFVDWKDDLQKNRETEKYPHPIFVIEDSKESSTVITEQPNSISTSSRKKSFSLDPDLDTTDLSLEMDSLATVSTMSLSPRKWSWRGEDVSAHYVNYPEDTRPSFKLPRRATSRKSTMVPIKLERMSLTCC